MSHTRNFIEEAQKGMSRRDREILERLYEQGFTDEDIFAALPTPGADALLKNEGESQ